MNRYINENDKKMDELLQKYIAGNASEKESQRIMEWLREDEQHLREYKRQRKLYDITLWQTKSPVDIQQEKKDPLRRVLDVIVRIAAVIVFTVATTYFYTHHVLQDKEENMQTVVVPAGQHAELYLADGTHVWLNSGSRLVVRSDAVRGADETAQAEIDQYASFHEPMHLRDERCYFHDLHADADGSVRIALVNDSLELGAVLRFNKNELPCLTEWKMLAEGEYVLGLEPGNTNPIGRLAAKERGMLQYLQPGEIRQTHIELEILDGGAAIRQAEQEIGGESI